MHIMLKTRVNQSVPTVWAGFDRLLFERLSPAFPPVKVIRFDGCMPGDVVHLQLNFIFFRQDWVSTIVDQQTSPEEIYFIDQGTQLPFFLGYWHHKHRLLRARDEKTGREQTIIADDITFRGPFRLADYLLYPVLWLQFACRKPVYRQVFGRP